MSLPIINVSIIANIQAFPEDGNLLYQYKPLQNLKVSKTDGSTDIVGLTLPCSYANINIDKPIALDTEVSYDESVNILVNDRVNPLKIVNSRFYLVDSSSYKIADRKGNLDTNIYTQNNFKIETRLIKKVNSIISLDFLGIYNGGAMQVGSYNFYFKLADADGNETDFVSESGKVVCHIGAVNQPSSIRGGQLNENSDKIIKFRLNNLDLAYDYINIYCTRNTGDELTEVTKAYKILDKFKINSTSTIISITGYEEFEEIDITEINIQYADFESTKTTANCQNITFAGNITRNYEVFKTLEKYSLFITPKLLTEEESLQIGNLGYDYTENYPDQNIGFEYYNANNIYYKLGYWNEDIYRFGIVYILNDYTLSPVFNIRGIKELGINTSFYPFNLEDELNYGEDYLFEKAPLENSKGVLKISSTGKVFNGNQTIKPIGIKFNFESNVITGGTNKWLPGLKDLTKGFFIVRQKRIPTLLTQAIAIGSSSKTFTPVIQGRGVISGINTSTYFSESFLTLHEGKPKLGRDLFSINSADIKNNVLLCPEASLRPYIFNNFFNSSEFTLKLSNNYTRGYFSDSGIEKTLFNLGNVSSSDILPTSNIITNLLLVEAGIDLINNNDYKFSSKAGNELEAWKHIDPILGDLENFRDTIDLNMDSLWSTGVSKIRGEFNSYIGCSTDALSFGQYYNIFQKDYNFEDKWKDYFRIRYNDSSPFLPISDRISWDNITTTTLPIYRGDCYINTISQRILWNFIDPELPTNNTIIDPYTWYKNYKVKKITSTLIDVTSGIPGTSLDYRKVLQLFTYKDIAEASYSGDSDTIVNGIIEPDGKKFKKYSEANGTFGASKINRPDVNAVPIGHWVTYKICSNINLAMRDVDFSRPEEEALHKMKRSFYPLQAAKPTNKLPESSIINSGISKPLGNKQYFEIPDVPFIKTDFTNRIYYSDILQESSFKNGNRIFKSQNYQDYTREYGALVSLIEWYGKLIAVMEHGVLMIPVNERAMMANAQGENVYINTDTVLPKNPRVLSNSFGSVWTDSVIKTPRFIYGIDTIAKKIWRTDGEKFELISDLKIQKFLNDHIKLKVVDRNNTPGTYSIKSHYNAFKYDVLFTFVYETEKWHLCWNEMLNKWTTQYSWFPEFSENINNIFYTFANSNIYPSKANILFKHGFAGGVEESGDIKPTMWYDTQEPFELEFVVIGVQGVQKVFDNLKIISNLTQPDSFFYEIVGEGFTWNTQKDLIILIGDITYVGIVDSVQMPAKNIGESDADYLARRYKTYLLAKPSVKKIPFINVRDLETNWVTSGVIKDLTLEQHNKTKENLISSYQKGLDIKTNGRLKGNMQYVEDFWDIQIQPISFKYAYISAGNIAYTINNDMRIRDKYIKIRVKYDGTHYAIINALKTMFTVSYS